MTDQTPVERAAAAIDENYNPDQAPILAAMFQDYAHAVFDSIDVEQLADVLSTLTTCDGQPHASELHHRQARAVKNWLTGKDQT